MASAVNAVESSVMRLGLLTPSRRFFFASAVTSAVLWGLQPRAAFLNGRPRPFAGISDGRQEGISPTKTPWWLLAGIVGMGAATFI